MPLHEDRIRTLEARVRIPEGEIPGAYLTRLVPSSVATNEDTEVGWTSPPDPQVKTWHGNPDGTLVAAKGDLCIDLDTPALYQNTDGQQTWASPGGINAVTFSYPGALDSGIESPPWYPPASLTFTHIRVSLLANASADHIIKAYVNGSLFGTYTLSSGSKTYTTTISMAVTSSQPLTVKTDTVSDSDLSVQFWVI